jgi:hypothetical protein
MNKTQLEGRLNTATNEVNEMLEAAFMDRNEYIDKKNATLRGFAYNSDTYYPALVGELTARLMYVKAVLEGRPYPEVTEEYESKKTHQWK